MEVLGFIHEISATPGVAWDYYPQGINLKHRIITPQGFLPSWVIFTPGNDHHGGNNPMLHGSMGLLPPKDFYPRGGFSLPSHVVLLPPGDTSCLMRSFLLLKIVN